MAAHGISWLSAQAVEGETLLQFVDAYRGLKPEFPTYFSSFE